MKFRDPPHSQAYAAQAEWEAEALRVLNSRRPANKLAGQVSSLPPASAWEALTRQEPGLANQEERHDNAPGCNETPARDSVGGASDPEAAAGEAGVPAVPDVLGPLARVRVTLLGRGPNLSSGVAIVLVPDSRRASAPATSDGEACVAEANNVASPKPTICGYITSAARHARSTSAAFCAPQALAEANRRHWAVLAPGSAQPRPARLEPWAAGEAL